MDNAAVIGIAQSEILAYTDVFSFCAILAFAAMPLVLLFSPVKASRADAGAGGH